MNEGLPVPKFGTGWLGVGTSCVSPSFFVSESPNPTPQQSESSSALGQDTRVDGASNAMGGAGEPPGPSLFGGAAVLEEKTIEVGVTEEEASISPPAAMMTEVKITMGEVQLGGAAVAGGGGGLEASLMPKSAVVVVDPPPRGGSKKRRRVHFAAGTAEVDGDSAARLHKQARQLSIQQVEQAEQASRRGRR